MAHKKVLLVIVEGPSDDTALGYVLSKICEKERLFVHVVHGDITTRNGVSSKTIVNKVGDEVKKFIDNNPYKQSDFKAIIHLVDTDGAFIPDEGIIEDDTQSDCLYLDTEIRTVAPDRIKKRNHQKQETLFRLVQTPRVRKIPYRVYYMSCNLDHVLYDKRNSTDEEKENDAYTFTEKYKDDIPAFLEYMCESPFSANGSYKESWDYIMKDYNSLQRHSNLCVWLKETTGETL